MVVLDVVENILSRLLVKDLLRYKSVCKSWYSLISSPYFVKTHLKFICNKEDISTRRIAMMYRSSERSVQGSSNGLVCIYVGYKIIVTNPVTREFREFALPDLPERRVSYWQCMGFGYDSSTDDYKVFWAICNRDTTLVHILSLKSNIWKSFGRINYSIRKPEPGILFNGAIHWFCFYDANYTGERKALVVSFDLAKEEFREIPQPDDTRYVWNNDDSLGIIEGSLCILKKSYYVNDHHCIWVMKNYNGKPSWEPLPITKYCEMKDHAIHYMLKDCNEYRKTRQPTYFCDDNIRLSRSKEHISSPIFVQTLVSPYVKGNFAGYTSKRETEEEEKGVVTNTYKNESKDKKKVLKSFYKKERV